MASTDAAYFDPLKCARIIMGSGGPAVDPSFARAQTSRDLIVDKHRRTFQAIGMVLPSSNIGSNRLLVGFSIHPTLDFMLPTGTDDDSKQCRRRALQGTLSAYYPTTTTTFDLYEFPIETLSQRVLHLISPVRETGPSLEGMSIENIAEWIAAKESTELGKSVWSLMGRGTRHPIDFTLVPISLSDEDLGKIRELRQFKPRNGIFDIASVGTAEELGAL